DADLIAAVAVEIANDGQVFRPTKFHAAISRRQPAIAIQVDLPDAAAKHANGVAAVAVKIAGNRYVSASAKLEDAIQRSGRGRARRGSDGVFEDGASSINIH